MRILTNLILVSFFISSSLFGQRGQGKTVEIVYHKAFKKINDTSDSEPKVLKGLEYKLVCNSNESRFEYIPSLTVDTDGVNKRFIGRSGGKGVYYRNLKSKEKIHQQESLSEEIYLIEEKTDKFDWQLTKESKIILGYRCFKATAIFEDYSHIRKKKILLRIEAWYAPSLPLPFGPAGYDGLPGLVLEASMSSFYFVANDIKFLKLKKEKLKKPTRGKKVSFSEFNKILFEELKKITGQ